MKKRLKKMILCLAAVCAVCYGALAIYASDYYRSDAVAVAALAGGEGVTVEITDSMAVFRPDKAEAGFIFYPGGKVEYTAYAPLMYKLAQNDIVCIITEMPFNLAVMNADAADKAYGKIADVERWYIGGHSLGGSMAASFVSDSDIDFEGLVLLASYSTADLSADDVEVLSVYGTEDRVLNMEKYKEYYSNLPKDTTEFVIEGGNHAQFGSYGLQKGDGTASVTAEQQLETAAEAIIEFMQ
ncbi:MAG: lysophospholipase [Oscillospiraceae bacterium]|nr:lysophospholipase [Oscillospiraceae bacterium]